MCGFRSLSMSLSVYIRSVISLFRYIYLKLMQSAINPFFVTVVMLRFPLIGFKDVFIHFGRVLLVVLLGCIALYRKSVSNIFPQCLY